MSFTPGTASLPTTEVEISISCRSLKGKDVLSKSDCMCVTYIQPFGGNNWVEYHRTEVIYNCHDPDFTRKVHISYRFEEQQPLKFEIYDIDSDSPLLSSHDFLGTASCNLGQIIGSGQVQLPLAKRRGGETKGSLLIKVEELQALKDEVVLKLSGHKLDKKDFLGKSDPFLEIHKSMESGEYSIVHKTEVLKSTLNPQWATIRIPVRTLCNGDAERSLKFICYDWNSNGHHSLIGEFYSTLSQMKKGPGPDTKFALIHPKKKKGTYKNSGEITLDYLELVPKFSFIDYIKGGTQIFCTIAIDFTGSNGDPNLPSSLHFIGGANCYEQAISSVVTIIEDYDSDKHFPVLGFGARLPPDGRVSHEFFVNFHPTNPHCFGLQGVLDAYRSCLRQIQLHGPTNFASVINHVANFASTYQDGSGYFILLILTDGVISDMPQTTKAIVNASQLPMSIIIVGIGSADFSAMDCLDADRVALKSEGVLASRDIVQFVPFNKFRSDNPAATRLQLAREVLAEVPTQLVSFMKANNIPPKPPQNNVLQLDPGLGLFD